jgi:hypothetical protein
LVIVDPNGGLLNLGVGLEVRPDQAAVPRPAVFGVGRRVHTGEAAAAVDVALEGALLLLVEHIASGGKPYHGGKPGEVSVGERRRVLRCLDVELVLRTELGDCRYTSGN